jgi:hypothetical protein
MSRKKIIIGGVAVVVLLAAVGSAAGQSQNSPANTPRPTSQSSSDPASSDAASAPSEAPATASAAPAETDATGSGTYAIGDSVKLGDEEYFSLTDVDPAPKVNLVEPDAGNKFVSVLVEIEGINPNGATYNPFFFTARGDDGFEYNFSAFGKEPQLKSSNDLGPGKKVKGWITFEVPVAAKHVTIVYAPGLFNEPVEIGVDL